MTRHLVAALGLALLTPAAGKSAVSTPVQSPQPLAQAGKEAQLPGHELVGLEEAKRKYRGPLARVVLDFLTVMDRVVNKDKQPAITTSDWAPLGAMIDQKRFHRVGNFGVRNDWPSYADLLTRWANSSWWKGYIWRLREVPGRPGEPGLVYLETEERSNQRHPVKEDGDYSTLSSMAVYEIDANNKIVGLHVYDQRPR